MQPSMQRGARKFAMRSELDALADSGLAISDNVMPNSVDEWLYGDFELSCEFGSAPTAGTTVSLYAIPTFDGTNFADGVEDDVVPQDALLLGSFVLANATSQRRALLNLRLPAEDFKTALYNESGQAMAATGNILSYVGHVRSYGD